MNRIWGKLHAATHYSKKHHDSYDPLCELKDELYEVIKEKFGQNS